MVLIPHEVYCNHMYTFVHLDVCVWSTNRTYALWLCLRSCKSLFVLFSSSAKMRSLLHNYMKIQSDKKSSDEFVVCFISVSFLSSSFTHLVCLLFNFSSVVQYELSRVSKHMNFWWQMKENKTCSHKVL